MTRGEHDIQKDGYYGENGISQIVSCGELFAFFFSFTIGGTIPDSSPTASSLLLSKIVKNDDVFTSVDSIELDHSNVNVAEGAFGNFVISFGGGASVNVSPGLYQYILSVFVPGLGYYDFKSQPFLMCGSDGIVSGDFSNEFTNEFF